MSVTKSFKAAKGHYQSSDTITSLKLGTKQQKLNMQRSRKLRSQRPVNISKTPIYKLNEEIKTQLNHYRLLDSIEQYIEERIKS